MPLARRVVEAVAVDNGVCIRPLAMRRIDTTTGETSVHPVPCGATLASRCPACAEHARRLRMAQCAAGWHRDSEPLPDPEPATEEMKTLAMLRADLIEVCRHGWFGDVELRRDQTCETRRRRAEIVSRGIPPERASAQSVGDRRVRPHRHDQLPVGELLDAEVGQLPAVAGPLDTAEGQFRLG